MKNIGYTHQGYSISYFQTSQIRWLSVLDLNNKDTDMLLSEMDYQTRRNIKKTYEMNVQVRTLSIEETSRFFKLFKMAEEKHGFKFRNQDYFEKMQKIYNDNSMLKLAYINLSDLLEKQNNKITQLNKQYEEIIRALKENPNSKKIKIRLIKLINKLVHKTEK